MSTLAVLQAGREAAERLMRTTVRISRPIGDVTFTGLTPSREQTLVYEGKGKVQAYEAYESERTSVDSSVTVARVRLDIPIGAAKLEPGDHCEVIECLDDPELNGALFRISGLAPYKSMATAYRVFMDKIERG